MNSEKYVRAFLLAGTFWLVIGLLFLVTVIVGPLHELVENLPAPLGEDLDYHFHKFFYLVQLYGFVVMLICGVSYHILPRFFGRAELVESGYLSAWWQFWFMNLGIATFLGGAGLKLAGFGEFFGIVAYGGVCALALGLLIYARNVVKTIW
jgi:hypothetical protein